MDQSHGQCMVRCMYQMDDVNLTELQGLCDELRKHVQCAGLVVLLCRSSMHGNYPVPAGAHD